MHGKRKPLKPDNVLIIGDTHIPFEHPDYLQFCIDIQRRFGCGTVVHIGDLVDNHSMSYHEHDPDGRSPADEMELSDKQLIPWFKAFPRVNLCLGNHDRMIDRKSKTAGLPSRAFRRFRDIWNLPTTWAVEFEYSIDGVLYKHGTGCSGKYAHLQSAIDERSSCVIGHLHANSGIEWTQNGINCIFGMATGCGIDRYAYAHAYGIDFRRKPFLSVGIVTDKGRFAQVIPMGVDYGS